jgi:hypothetical protein
MKKILFPFNSKYQHLKKYWWHRLFIVIFVLVVLFVGVSVWQSALQQEAKGYKDCITSSNYIYDSGYLPIPANQSAITEQKCSDTFPIHPLLDFSFGLIVAIITFYFLQIIYYKILLYIVFGPKQNTTN